MIKFRSQLIPGSHNRVHTPMSKLQTRRTFFWGLNGESEIIGGHAGRELSVFMWIYNQFSNEGALRVFLDVLDARIGEHGKLEETDTGNYSQIYFRCTFTGFEPLPFEGRSEPDPIEDIANTVDGGWVQAGKLHFYQLRS